MINNLAKGAPAQPAATPSKRADDARAAMIERNNKRWSKAQQTQ